MLKAHTILLSRHCHCLFGLLLSALAVLPLHSQSGSPVDSLKRLLSAEPGPANTGTLLNEISAAYSVYQFDSAYHYALLAEAAGIARKDTSVMARACILQGTAAAAQGNLATSIRKTKQGLNLALAVNDSANIAKAYNNLAIEDMNAGDTQQALIRFQKSLDFTTDDTLGRIYTLNNIGLLYENSGDLTASDKYMAQALKAANESDDPLVLLEVYFTKGLIAMNDTTQLDSALLLFERIIDISRAYNDLAAEAHALINIGIIHRDTRHTERSKKVLQQAIFSL